jgi:hypothetical protein
MAKWGEIKCPRCEEADDLVKRMNNARDFPANTCGASRHAAMIAEALCSGDDYPMLAEEPDHCGGSIAATVAALWECRTKLAQQDDLVQAAEGVEGRFYQAAKKFHNTQFWSDEEQDGQPLDDWVFSPIRAALDGVSDA